MLERDADARLDLLADADIGPVDWNRCDTYWSLQIANTSGRRYEIATDDERDQLVIRSRHGDVVLRIAGEGSLSVAGGTDIFLGKLAP